MPVSRSRRGVLCGASGLLALSGLHPLTAAVAQQAARGDAPSPSPPGGTPPSVAVAPYVPTPPAVVTAMLDLAAVGNRDTVADLGSGDGRIVIEAAKRYGARGFGIDLDPDLVKIADENAIREGVQDRVRFQVGDLFKASLNQATVVTVYLLPSVAARLVAKLYEDLAAGARIVSHDYALGPLVAEKRIELSVPEKQKVTGTPRTFLYLYIVAAAVRGRWTMILPKSLGNRVTAVFEQQYDHVSGWLETSGARVPMRDARISGTDLSFQVAALGAQRNVLFQLSLQGNSMEGVANTGGVGLQVTAFRDTPPR